MCATLTVGYDTLRPWLGVTRVTRYAGSGDLNIAYQVLGDGAIDLVYVPGWIPSVECQPASCPHSSNGWTTSAR